MTGNEILSMKGVSKRYPLASGTVHALKETDFSLYENQFVAVTGPSGSGKTTLLMLATLLDAPSSGSVMFDGRDVQGFDEAGLSALRARSVGVVFQNFHLLAGRTVLENVLFRFRYLETAREEASAAALEALGKVGLADLADHPAHLLSGGEMQRAAIARAIASEPRLLAADEPTGNLDTAAAGTVMDCLRGLNEAGTTIVMVTHNESLVGYANRHVRCVNGMVEG